MFRGTGSACSQAKIAVNNIVSRDQVCSTMVGGPAILWLIVRAGNGKTKNWMTDKQNVTRYEKSRGMTQGWIN